MAVEFPNGEGRPREELERFIASLHEFLWEILKKFRELLEPEFIQEAERALEETSNHFNDARRAIAETSDAALASHGLTGAVLRFKLRIVRWLMDKFYRNPSGDRWYEFSSLSTTYWQVSWTRLAPAARSRKSRTPSKRSSSVRLDTAHRSRAPCLGGTRGSSHLNSLSTAARLRWCSGAGCGAARPANRCVRAGRRDCPTPRDRRPATRARR